MSQLNQYLAGRLAQREQAGNMRRLSTARAAADLYSNDYLGLATTGLLNNIIEQTFTESGATVSTGSRLLSGNSHETAALEDNIARFHGAEAALLFNSGYDANTGLLSALSGRHNIMLYDELCHASIIDGVRLGINAGKYTFRHNDLSDLAAKLQQYASRGTLIVVVESIYSMDGDAAPLAAMADLCATHDAALIVDEAHATGVYGAHGEGLVCSLGLQRKVFARVHTFGKALGCHGAAVVGGSLLRNFLVNFSRQFIYTTALPQHSVRAIAGAYQYLAHSNFSNLPLHQLIAAFRERVHAAGQTGWVESHSPIQAYITGNNERARALAARLQAAGLQVNAILSPTVPQGLERLRVCLHTFNTTAQLDRLVQEIAHEI